MKAAAAARAREELGAFDAALKSEDGKYSRFAIKQAFKVPGGREEIWVSGIKKKEETYRGAVFNKPLYIENLAQGDSITVDRDAIIDWMYVEDDTLRGGYAKRLLSEEDRPKFDRETAYVVEDYGK